MLQAPFRSCKKVIEEGQKEEGRKEDNPKADNREACAREPKVGMCVFCGGKSEGEKSGRVCGRKVLTRKVEMCVLAGGRAG